MALLAAGAAVYQASLSAGATVQPVCTRDIPKKKKKSLDFLSEEVSAVRLQQKSILDLVKEVKALRLQNAKKDKRIASLESRVSELEQFTRMNNIVTGA